MGVVNSCSREISEWELSGRFVVVFLFFSRFAPINSAPAAVMPGIEKLPLEETLEDSPQVTVFFPGSIANASRFNG